LNKVIFTSTRTCIWHHNPSVTMHLFYLFPYKALNLGFNSSIHGMNCSIIWWLSFNFHIILKIYHYLINFSKISFVLNKWFDFYKWKIRIHMLNEFFFFCWTCQLISLFWMPSFLQFYSWNDELLDKLRHAKIK
jgi:hypothetical protein